MAEAYDIREIPIAEREDVLELTEMQYGPCDLATRAYFDWQYEDNPAGRAIIVGAYHEGTLATVLANIPMPISVDGREITIVQSVNLVTHPEHRRRGLFLKCGKALCDLSLERGYPFVIGFPNQGAIGGWRRLGHTELGTPQLLIQIRRPFQLAAESFGWRKGPYRTEPLALGPGIREVSSLAEMGLDHLQSAAKFSLTRDPTWFDWRYCRCPTRDYRVFVLGDTEAVLITRTSVGLGRMARSRVLYVMDILYPRSGLPPAIFPALKQIAKAERASAILASVCHGSDVERRLSSNGFFPIPDRLRSALPVIIRSQGDIHPRSLPELDISFGLSDRV